MALHIKKKYWLPIGLYAWYLQNYFAETYVNLNGKSQTLQIMLSPQKSMMETRNNFKKQKLYDIYLFLLHICEYFIYMYLKNKYN